MSVGVVGNEHGVQSRLCGGMTTQASDADVERSLLEAGSYWSTMQHLLAIMSGRKSSMSVLHWLPGELLTNIARLAIRLA